MSATPYIATWSPVCQEAQPPSPEASRDGPGGGEALLVVRLGDEGAADPSAVWCALRDRLRADGLAILPVPPSAGSVVSSWLAAAHRAGFWWAASVVVPPETDWYGHTGWRALACVSPRHPSHDNLRLLRRLQRGKQHHVF